MSDTTARTLTEAAAFRCGHCGAPALGYGETNENGVFQTLCSDCGEWTEHEQETEN